MIKKCTVRLYLGLTRCLWRFVNGAIHLRYGCTSGRIAIHPAVRFWGAPVFSVAAGGQLRIGANCSFYSRLRDNMAGVQRPCSVLVASGACVEIGRESGLSGVAIYSVRSVVIGDHVNIGANVSIWDTDFHELDAMARRRGPDRNLVRSAPVRIHDDAFIGASVLILKGVTIGAGAIVGAGSVVTHDIPAGQIWAGNPARRIR